MFFFFVMQIMDPSGPRGRASRNVPTYIGGVDVDGDRLDLVIFGG